MYKIEGKKFRATENITGSELVKLIKQDLRDNLPKEYKVLAHKEEYAGGWSIHFTIKNTGTDKYSTAGADDAYLLEKKVKTIVEAYNFDDGDSMSDYYHVRFYAHIKIEK